MSLPQWIPVPTFVFPYEYKICRSSWLLCDVLYMEVGDMVLSLCLLGSVSFLSCYFVLSYMGSIGFLSSGIGFCLSQGTIPICSILPLYRPMSPGVDLVLVYHSQSTFEELYPNLSTSLWLGLLVSATYIDYSSLVSSLVE